MENKQISQDVIVSIELTDVIARSNIVYGMEGGSQHFVNADITSFLSTLFITTQDS